MDNVILNAIALHIIAYSAYYMDTVKKILRVHAGGVFAVTTAIVASTVFRVAAPVAIGIGYAIVGGSMVAAVKCG